MDFLNKKKRNINFNKGEKELYMELATSYKHIIENKKTDAVMWRKKEECRKRKCSKNNNFLFYPATI